MVRICHLCGAGDRELRPYGPGGSPICYPCATGTPEREREAEMQFSKRFEGEPIVIVQAEHRQDGET